MELLRLLATQEKESVVVTAVYAFLHAWCRQPASVEVQISSPGRHMLLVRRLPVGQYHREPSTTLFSDPITRVGPRQLLPSGRYHHCPLRHTAVGRPASGPFSQQPCARLVRYRVVEQKLSHAAVSARHMRAEWPPLSAECWRWRVLASGACALAEGRRVSLRPVRRGRQRDVRQTARAASVRPCGGIDLRHSFITDGPVRLGFFAGLCYCT